MIEQFRQGLEWEMTGAFLIISLLRQTPHFGSWRHGLVTRLLTTVSLLYSGFLEDFAAITALNPMVSFRSTQLAYEPNEDGRS